MSSWTPGSLRIPRRDDAPFYAIEFGLIVAGDAVVHLAPKTTSHFNNIARRYPTLPLRDEMSRLCSVFYEEALSALADALRQTAAGHVRRGRPSQNSGYNAADAGKLARLPPVMTKQFQSAVRKYPTLPLHDELKRLCHTFPADALSALADALRQTLAGHVKRRAPRLQGLSGPDALIRAEVQARRRQGLSDVQIAREIVHLLPRGQSEASRRTRARREVAKVPVTASTGAKISFATALELWADLRAQLQLRAAVRRGLLTREEAELRRAERKSRFMSRAEGKHPL